MCICISPVEAEALAGAGRGPKAGKAPKAPLGVPEADATVPPEITFLASLQNVATTKSCF